VRAEQATAKASFLLSDADFKKLGFITKANPHKKDWSAMKLYLQRQVEELSHQKHGGEDGLEGALSAHHNRRYAAAMKKRGRDEQQAAREDARVERVRKRIEEENSCPVEASEVVEEVETDRDKGLYERTLASGMKVEVEMI
jgi:XPA protein C-terminus